MLIAQVSDFHITATGTAYGQAPTTESLARAVDHLNAMAPAPDVVIITGDVADAGEPEAYAAAAAELGRLDAPFLMVPGNHDQRDRMAEAFPGNPCLRSRGEDGRIRFVNDDYDLRLVGLDTLMPGHHGGGLDTGTLDWLAGVLRDGKPSVLFMHHPPFPVGIHSMDSELFVMAEAFESVVRGAPNVLRVCCGHMHRPVLRAFGGTTACISPALGMQLDLNLTGQGPTLFMMEPMGMALHLYDSLENRLPELVTHFALMPGLGHSFEGPYPFTDVVSPV